MAISRSVEIWAVHWWLCASYAKSLTKSQHSRFFVNSAIRHPRNCGWRSMRLRSVWNFEWIPRLWPWEGTTIAYTGMRRRWKRPQLIRVSLSGLCPVTQSKNTKSRRQMTHCGKLQKQYPNFTNALQFPRRRFSSLQAVCLGSSRQIIRILPVNCKLGYYGPWLF